MAGNGRLDDSWAGLISSRADHHRPWLIVPTAPQRGSEHRALAYADLLDKTTRIGCFLQLRGVGVGQRVVVVADSSPESALLILGVLFSGRVVVPVAPPGLWLRGDAWETALERICAECSPSLLLLGEQRALAGRCLPSGLAACDFAQASGTRATKFVCAYQADDLALIQYTSGTTARPRGVELTHSNLLYAVESIGNAFGASSNDVGVSWLPQFHDMGLIGGLLFCAFWGMPMVQLLPRIFGMRPESWLWAMARFGGTCSAAPNSAYHTCADRIRDDRLVGLDLSRWRIAFNGAELIHERTLERFRERFAQYGFNHRAMFPVYGLAENTVAATLPRYGSAPRIDHVDADLLEQRGLAVRTDHAAAERRTFVCVGGPIAGQVVRIVDQTSFEPLSERTVGEIQLRGPCMMRGYFGRDRSEAFTSDGWLRTGDRGYIADGDLFVTGRYKHIIKRGGRAIEGEALENAVRCLPRIRGGAVAVFGVPSAEDGRELLIVMAETDETDSSGRASLTRAIADELRSSLLPVPDSIHLVGPRTIPRTSSGKTRHGDAAAIYLEAASRP